MCFLHIRHYVLQHKLSLYKYFKCSFFKEGSLCKSCFFHQQILLCVQFCVRLLFFRFCFVHFVYELLLFNIFPIFFMMPKYIGSPVTCSVSLYFFTIFSHCTEKSGQALDRLERAYGKRKFKEIFKTITVDNGVEFADYENLIKYDRTKIYYCHPYCSGERGSNENQNKLVRRWIKKGDDIGKFTKQDIRKINDWINQYPRKMFKGLSSQEMLVQHE